MATGVLVVGVGRATRLLGHLALSDKTYAATIRLGQTTTTDDADGEIIEALGASHVDEAALEAAVEPLRGDIIQVPSAVSAIKIDGQRAYARVRRGEEVQLDGRPVTVSRFEVVETRSVTVDDLAVLDVDVMVDCSSGTYIRALARDLGRALGTGGHLTALRRTRVGDFTLDDVSFDGVLPELERGERYRLELISMVDTARRCFPVVEVDADTARRASHGSSLRLRVRDNPTAVLHGDVFLGLYRPDSDDSAVPVAIFC